MKVDEYGFTYVKTTNYLEIYEIFILASLAGQVFYFTNNIDPTWSIVLLDEVRE